MEQVRLLFIEENAQEYLNTRQLLDEQTNRLNIDWAPNYEMALKRIKQNRYEVYMVGYHNNLTQKRFFYWLSDYATVPIVILMKTDDTINPEWLEKPQIEFLFKEQLSWPLLERTIRCLSNLLVLQNKQNYFQAIFNHTFQLIGLISTDGKLKEINQTALKFFGIQRQEVINFPVWETCWATYSSQTQALFKTAAVTACQGEFARCEIEVQKPTGQQISLDISFTPILNKKNKLLWILIEGRDLSERRTLEYQLNHSTLHDQLTGLPNRHLFMEHLEQAMNHARQQTDYRIAVLFMDLDRFRVINASLGHDMGDWLLMEIAQRLQTCLGHKDILARSGGDEFMILLDNMQDLDEATRLAQMINDVLAGPFSLDGYDLITSVSIGIAYYVNQEESTDLLRDADAAMYRAKAMGKSCYAVFDRGMHTQALSRLQIETDLYQALEKQSFVLFYQPQTELASEQLVGTETFIRFCHSQSGLISSVDFMPVLEDTGIIITIGEWILRTACRHFKSWLDAGLSINRMAVNLSAHQFRSKRLISTISESIERSGLKPECLELELTENVLLEDTNSAVKMLTRLKNMGIRVTIDDFGTGYASLNYLKRFPADCLKIDYSFIKGIISSPEDAAITVATIDMAHALGLTVIADGVETTEQRDFLRDHGCDFAQGHLYASPMENAVFLEWGRQYCKIFNVKSLDKK